MRRIANHRLVEVADLNIDFAVFIGYGAKVSNVAVAANPDRRSLRNLALVGRSQPFLKVQGIAAHIGMGRSGHFQIPALPQHRRPLMRPGGPRFLCHLNPALSWR
jgi:hypothetical protein